MPKLSRFTSTSWQASNLPRLATHPTPLARYLLVVYLLLIVYGSLYPFTGWRDQGLSPFAFLSAPLPRFISAFDVVANIGVYVPLGAFAMLSVPFHARGALACTVATLLAFSLSLALEAAQSFLPDRIPSNLDLVLNATGGFAGAAAAAILSRRVLGPGMLRTIRARLFSPGGRIDLGVVLLGLWLLTQLNPETLLFGAGDLRPFLAPAPSALYPAGIFVQVEAAVAAMNIAAVGLLVGVLSVQGRMKWVLFLGLAAAALVVRTLAFGVLFAPEEMLAWLTPGARLGVPLGIIAACLVLGLPRPLLVPLTGMLLMGATALVNLAPDNPYLAASLAVWRQGHFLNFNGLTRLVSTLWPFAAVCYLLFVGVRLNGERDNRAGQVR
jgi:VanZ family protein